MRQINFKLFVELNIKLSNFFTKIPIDGNALLEGALRIPDHPLQRVLHQLLLGVPVYLPPLERDHVAGSVVVDPYHAPVPVVLVEPKIMCMIKAFFIFFIHN